MATVPPAAAQSMAERARSAAQASRAKSSDSEALRRTYLTPGLSGQPIATIDNSRSFNPRLSCQKTATLMEVLIQPSATGDIGSVQIARDSDLDGRLDTRTALGVPLSGLCANGAISCTPGTWTQCRYFRWDTDPSGTPVLAETPMTHLAGCYCLNASCGGNLVWGNLPSVLKDLGGGIIGALTTHDARIGVAQAEIEGPVIRYVGVQTTACSADPALPQTRYQAAPLAIAADATTQASGNRVFQTLIGSPAAIGRTQQMRHCSISRQITATRPGIADIIDRTAGGYDTVVNGNAVDFYLGSPGRKSLAGGRCSLVDFRMTLHVGATDRIRTATLAHLAADDWAQLRIDNRVVASGEWSWTSDGPPPGSCEQNRTFHSYPQTDLTPLLTPGDHEIWLRVAVADRGDAIAQIHVQTDESCAIREQLVDQCPPLAGDPACRLDTEFVDGVQTFRNGVATGLTPIRQTRILGSQECPVQVTRDFFLRDRRYACTTDSLDLTPPDLSRGAYIIDHSTETMLADRTRVAGGGAIATTRAFQLPARGAVPTCEAVCKTRKAVTSNAAAPAGVVGAQQNMPATFDTFYHACGVDSACPIEAGEEIVTPCGCIDDFPEAVAMMQTVRLAGADMVCTRGSR